jgi:hypothetical protein
MAWWNSDYDESLERLQAADTDGRLAARRNHKATVYKARKALWESHLAQANSPVNVFRVMKARTPGASGTVPSISHEGNLYETAEERHQVLHKALISPNSADKDLPATDRPEFSSWIPFDEIIGKEELEDCCVNVTRNTLRADLVTVRLLKEV